MKGDLVMVEDVTAAFCTAVLDHFETSKGPRVFALSGGATAQRCYERLASCTDSDFWSALDVVWGDERCVPPDDADSNFALASTALGNLLESARSVHPMCCDDGADSYSATLASLGGLGVVHLGLGPDGHTASLFPGSDALTSTGDVALNHDPLGRNAHTRMTLTLRAIAQAELVLVTVEGSSKREALRRVIDGDVSAPAAQVDGKRVIWLVDGLALGSPLPR
jgi:6-phosphogluconolactonase